jgi:hypothetical protein
VVFVLLLCVDNNKKYAGNTISDMMGIGSAWYVETWATRLGAVPPDLTPAQLELTASRSEGLIDG